MHSRHLIITLCVGGCALGAGPTLARSAGDDVVLLAQSAVPSGDARRDATGVERDDGRDPESAPAAPRRGPIGPDEADVEASGPARDGASKDRADGKRDGGKAGGRDSAGFEKVEPHYAFAIDAPDPLRKLIERQTSLGKWRTRQGYDRDQFDVLLANLRAEIETICRAEGYFECVIEIGGDPSSGARVEVMPGTRTSVRGVDVRLEGEIDGQPELRERLLREWAMPVGRHYDAAGWEDAKRKLLAGLQQNGFLRAEIADSSATVDVQQAAAELRVVARSGRLIHFGELQINGLQRYPRKLIDGLKPFRDGSAYSYDQLQQFQTNLRDSGYFRNAYVTPDLDAMDRDPQATTVPLRLELTEEQVKRATFGVGYGTDAGARLILGLEHRNLFGRGDRMDSGLILEERRQRAFVGVRTPTEPSGHYWAYGARYDRMDVSGERTGTKTIYGGRGKQAGRIDTFVSLAHQDESQAIDLGGGNTAHESARATVVGFSWNYRALDSRIDPREGLSITAQASGAVAGLLTDTSFARLYTRTYYFLPLDRQAPNRAGMLVGKLELGQVFASTTQGIPSTNLFRAGGSQSIRGYDYNTIGVSRGEATVGGRVLGIASVEYQHPITEAVWGAVFMDAGGAAYSWGDYRLHKSYGLGVRLRTPVGPINLDAAYADSERRWRLQFSVGFLF
ncbi:MAG: BamA/TamA family outer membrane protein [Burkholderiaceae bacterium]